MTRPRTEQVCIFDTPHHLIASRCVRCSFLCGTDITTGKSFEHRRQWIENRIRLLSSIFTVEIAAYVKPPSYWRQALSGCSGSAF